MRKRVGRKRAGGRRRRVMRKRVGVPRSRALVGTSDFARVKTMLPNELPITTGLAYGFYNFSLSNSTRASAVAAGYEQYRIARVNVYIKPNADTFPSADVAILPNPPGAYGIPYMYYRVDKTGAFYNAGTTIQTLRISGCKPKRVDDKTLMISFRPAITLGTNDGGAPPAPPALSLAGALKVSPWIPTNANAGNTGAAWAPNSVDHYGITLGFDCPRQTGNWPCANVAIELVYEFRKPLWYLPPPAQGLNNPVDVDVLGKTETPLKLEV